MDFEALERLGRLRTSGAISDDEFNSEKQRILEGSLGSGEQAAKPKYEATNLDQDHVPQADAPQRSTRRTAVITILIALIFGAGSFVAYSYIIRYRKESTVASRAFSLRSQVKGIHIAALHELSRNPNGADKSCSSYEKTPVSGVAKAVALAGWHVTAEDAVGDLSAVSFVGACIPISATSFEVTDGNIGLYGEGHLKAVIYGKGIGAISRDTDRRRLQIKNYETGKVIARVVVTDRTISIKSK